MATPNERYSWHWEDGERESRKDAVLQAQRRTKKLTEQVRRIKLHLPEFAEPAEQVLRAVTAGLGKLLDLNITNRGPKYHAISPEEADHLIEAIPRVLRLWAAFTSTPGFAAAWEQMRPAFGMIERGDMAGALDHASKCGVL